MVASTIDDSTAATGHLPAGASTIRIGAGHLLLALSMIALGVRGLACGDFASYWQQLPIDHLPGQALVARLCALVELACGAGLLLRRTLPAASLLLAVYVTLWAVLLKLPGLLRTPGFEAAWLGFGEIAVIAAGAWTVLATHAAPGLRRSAPWLTGERGSRTARVVFGLALPMIGLSHFVYLDITAGLVPAWLPWHRSWAWLTGAADIAAGLAVLLSVWARLAATLDAAMMMAITLLVWAPGLVSATSEGAVTTFLMSAAIASGAWAVADGYRGRPWCAIPRAVLRERPPSTLAEIIDNPP